MGGCCDKERIYFDEMDSILSMLKLLQKENQLLIQEEMELREYIQNPNAKPTIFSVEVSNTSLNINM